MPPATSSTWITPIAQALADVAGGLSGLANDATVKGILWAPRDTDVRPAAVVEMPGIERTAADEAESQLGTRDVRLSFPVAFYFDLSEDVAYSQSQAVEVCEAYVDAIDAAKEPGQPLATDAISGGVIVVDAKGSFDPPEIFPPEASSGRPAIRYVCRVEVLAFIPDV